MKILIDPTLAILARDLNTEEKAELLMCILEYPSRDCPLGLWQYMKQQIDADAQKYREKCERAAEIQHKKSELKSTLKSELKSDMKPDLFSGVKVGEGKENIIKEKGNCKVGVEGKTESAVENPVDNFLISEDFSFTRLCKANPKLSNYLALYPPVVVERAEKTLLEKRFGRVFEMSELLGWVEKELGFYKDNHGGKL